MQIRQIVPSGEKPLDQTLRVSEYRCQSVSITEENDFALATTRLLDPHYATLHERWQSPDIAQSLTRPFEGRVPRVGRGLLKKEHILLLVKATTHTSELVGN